MKLKLNFYKVKFFCECPNNRVRIEYTLQIETDETLSVELIIEQVTDLDPHFHEELADVFLSKFGGTQMLTAMHHGVEIKTIR